MTRLLATFVTLALGAAACGPVTELQQGAAAPAAAATGGGFVGRQGTGLVRDGKPYRFAGINLYSLAGGPSASKCYLDHDPVAYNTKLAQAFDDFAAMHVKVVRFWAFQSYAGSTGHSFEAFDKIVALAKGHGMGVIPVLENEWSDCTWPEQSRKLPAWFAADYKKPYGYPLSYDAYVSAVVSHFKDEPAVVMWQLMNETESTVPSAMQSWAHDMAALIKGIDPNHLVNVGTLACTQAGTLGDDFRRLHDDANIDVVEAHDYDRERDVMPSCTAEDVATAKGLGKPFFIGEAGIDVGKFAGVERAALLRAKMVRGADEGFAGYLLWQYGSADGMGIVPNDPLANVLTEMADTRYH